MKDRIFIIHGLQSTPNKAWRPWLMAEMAKHEIYTCSLPMPNADNPLCEEWVKFLDQIIGDDRNVYLVGHSLGARAVLRYLEVIKNGPIKGAVIVAGRLGRPKSGILGSFYDDPINFEAIKSNCPAFTVIHGDDDPNIPMDDGKGLAEKLGGEFILVPGGGHLSGKSGFKELPQARDALFKMIKIPLI